MRTEILPGVSLKNKDWAEQVAQALKSHGIPPTVIYWPHWESGQQKPGWIESEAQKIVGRGETVNILAKSAGTAVAMVVLKLKPELINKLILCIQNEEDNHGSWAEAKEFLASLNPSINVVSKPRNDHEYPYSDEFIKFLSDRNSAGNFV